MEDHRVREMQAAKDERRDLLNACLRRIEAAEERIHRLMGQAAEIEERIADERAAMAKDRERADTLIRNT